MFVPGIWSDAVLEVRLRICRRPGSRSVDESLDRRFFSSGLQGVDSAIDDTWNSSVGIEGADNRGYMCNARYPWTRSA